MDNSIAQTGIVYVHVNKINGKVYVGQTVKTIEGRFSRGYKGSCYIYNAIQKYGPESFYSQILSHTKTKNEMDNLEKVWIILLQSMNRKFGYNMKSGGHLGGALCIESRNKIGNAHRGKILSEKQKSLMSKLRLGLPGPWTGKKFSEEHRSNLSKSHKGRPWSQSRREAQEKGSV